MKCTVSYHGAAGKKQINIPRNFIRTDFTEEQHDYILIFNGNQYYTKLPPSFFYRCPHLRTAYKFAEGRDVNYLHQWLEGFDGEVEVTKRGNLIELRKV